MSQSLTKVVIDTREQRPWAFDPARFITTSRKLDFGDYAIQDFENRFFIERKSLADFIGSVTVDRARLWAEFERARKAGARGIVIVGDHLDSLTGPSGTLTDVYSHRYRSRVAPEIIIGSAFAIWREFGFPVHFYGHAANRQAAHHLAKMAEYFAEKYVTFPKPKTGVNQ